jgi:YfiH family protein
MEWREEGGVRWLEAELPGARAAFSTRSAGSVKESFDPLAAALGLEADRIVTAHQVHGAELTHPGGRAPEADGHVLAEPGTAALVFVADCLPVAVAGPGGAAILHCGWRGLAAGIVTRGAAAVRATDAAIGPGIGQCCYEVGDEVLEAFGGLGPGVAAGRMLDLAEVARLQLAAAGVERIEVAGLCASCEEEQFFSHRRDQGRTGRQAGVIWLEGNG